jgi:predicted dinucleotide-binding enzyme
MQITMVGSGMVGGTLGLRWAALGHQVTFAVRDPARGAGAIKGLDAAAPLPAGVRLALPDDALRGAPDAVVLATPWAAVAPFVTSVADALAGRVVLDATNPLGPGFQLLHGPAGESGAEQVQALIPAAQVVKIFNSTGYANMADPRYHGEASVMFHAGNDAAAKGVASELATALGFESIDAGPLTRARQLEHLAVLWITLAYGGPGQPGLGRDFALRVVRR